MSNTLDYYNNNAEQFFDTTYQVNMQSLYAEFLKHIPEHATILDLGCGSGRDALAFKNMGYTVEASDYSKQLVEKARQLTGLDVRHESFYELSEQDKYHGIWACASLLHCERNRLPDVFNRIANALKINGVCYMSFKYGTEDRELAGRNFTDLNEHQVAGLMSHFENIRLLKQWITLDKRLDRNEQWLNVLIQKLES